MTKWNLPRGSAAVMILSMLTLVRPATATVDPSETEAVIDLAICLDTSNSMDGLIESAKLKLWDIVSTLAAAEPTPKLRVALLSYGNDGYNDEGWVRKDLDFTDDLDLVYEKLNALSTNGGTEYVSRVVRQATLELGWSDTARALKLIFVAGNESAAQDPKFTLKAIAKAAVEREITVNPIYCGNPMDEDAQSWREVARLADGEFAAIDQDEGTVTIVTPMDQELVDLSTQLNGTYIGYGAKAEESKARQEAQDTAAGSLSTSAGASRAVAKSGKLYTNSSWDLVDASEEEEFDLAAVDEEALPAEMQKMSPEEREAYVEEMKTKRAQIQEKINELNRKRQEYISAEMKKQNVDEDKALDKAMKETLRKQAAKKEIQID